MSVFFEKEWINYTVNKNYANSLAKNDWILSVDADEVLSDELINTLQTLKPVNSKVYLLDRISNYCGIWIKYGSWYPDWKVRLFNKKDVLWKGDFVHETLNIPSDFEYVRLKGKLLHYSYKTEQEFEERLNKYANLAAEDLFSKSKKASFFKRYFSPIIRFLRDFIFKKGFLDGKTGYKIALGNASAVYRKYQILKKLRKI